MSKTPAKQPWLKFFPADWRSDPAVRACSMAARGLWMEMLCLMHSANPRGYLVLNDKPMTDRQLSTLAGCSLKDAQVWLAELEEAGVFSRGDNGTIFSRRILRDLEKAEQDKANGGKGGNPNLKVGVNPPDKAQKPEARSQKPKATAADAAAATLPPPALDDLRKVCVEAAGRDFTKGFGLIVELATVHPVETRILPIIRECVADMATRGEKAHSWAYFAEAISDPLRVAPAQSAPLVEFVWCEKGSPEFERGNAARVARGEDPWRGLPSRHHGRIGASFPAADVRDDRAQA